MVCRPSILARSSGAEPRGVCDDAISGKPLDEAGLRVRIAPSGRGLVAEPEGQRDRKRVAIRADIDALRIADAKSVPYRSSREGLMHACGHDAHATMRWSPRWPCGNAATTSRKRWHGGSSSNRPRRSARARRDDRRGGPRGRPGDRRAARRSRAERRPHRSPHRCPHRLLPGGADPYPGREWSRRSPAPVRGPDCGGRSTRVEPYQIVPRSVNARDPCVVTFGCIRGGSSPMSSRKRSSCWGRSGPSAIARPHRSRSGSLRSRGDCRRRPGRTSMSRSDGGRMPCSTIPRSRRSASGPPRRSSARRTSRRSAAQHGG